MTTLYHAPEQEYVLAAMSKPRDLADDIGDDAGTVRDALVTYANRLDELHVRRTALITDIGTLNRDLKSFHDEHDDDFIFGPFDRADENRLLGRQSGLRGQCGDLERDLRDAQLQCARKIRALWHAKGPIPQPAGDVAMQTVFGATDGRFGDPDSLLDLTQDNASGQAAGGPVSTLPTDPEVLLAMLNKVRALRVDGQPVPEWRYSALLAQYWTARAAKNAGIDLDKWDPSKGTSANQATIYKVYDFYGKFFLKDPDKYQWAGMANMIGPSFGAGFQDLEMFKRIAAKVSSVPGAPPAASVVANLTADELRWYESKFLSMQKKIFFDQGAMHTAYDSGGLKSIDEMAHAGLIRNEDRVAWQTITNGSPSQVAAANKTLLEREQRVVIKEPYDEMRNRPVTGQAVTYLMTTVGSASIPGTKTPSDFDPAEFDVDPNGVLPGKVHVTTPIPGFNVSNDAERWKYIEKDTLPAYQKFLSEHPEQATATVSSDLKQRFDRQRLLNPERFDELMEDLTDGKVDLRW